VKQIGTEHI